LTTNIKITSLNGEWMNDWFEKEHLAFKPTFQDKGSKKIMNTDKTATKLSELIKAIDSDIYGIQEGPSSLDEMRLFISNYLNDKYAAEVGLDGSAQKIYVIYRKSFFDNVTSLTHTYPKWKFDNNGDYVLEEGKFTRTLSRLALPSKDTQLGSSSHILNHCLLIMVKICGQILKKKQIL